jgi:MoaA/NifB/PqqE/SkfB family radical SAM enzyme
MPINEATLSNLRRKSAFVDTVQLYEGKPLFSWVDLSLTELCNRSAGAKNACTFCPRYDGKFYPNQNLHMPLALVNSIASQLRALSYTGTIVLCGYGEPLLHPQILEVLRLLRSSTWRLEIVTNGDFLGARLPQIQELGAVDYYVVSMYDGPHQVDKFHAMMQEAGVDKEHYLLRDRWHSAADQFGLKLTNRAGVVGVGPQEAVDTHRPCYYLTYQMQVDWNGDVLLCPQDWYKKLKFGNLGLERMVDVWFSLRIQKRRMELIKGYRSQHPCNGCNTDGKLHGFNHVEDWLKK